MQGPLADYSNGKPFKSSNSKRFKSLNGKRYKSQATQKAVDSNGRSFKWQNIQTAATQRRGEVR
jgi:hypothetical protein